MHLDPTASSVRLLGRGVLAALAGTAVMTAFQKFVEMLLAQRRDSYAPAQAAESFGAHPATPAGRRRLNYTVHVALGGVWGAAFGIAAARGLRGQQAVTTVFALVYTGDVLLNTLSGLYHSRRCTAKGWAIDVVDKYVQAQATGAVFDRVLDPARRS